MDAASSNRETRMIRHRAALATLALSFAVVVVLAIVATRQVSAGIELSPSLVAALVMLEAAGRKELSPDQISFVDAVRWLCHVQPGQSLNTLASLVVLPHRPGRVEPRVRKRRPKQYPLMKKPRAVLTKALMAKGSKA